jgi:tRNA (guanine37-N1)-methyltransferase
MAVPEVLLSGNHAQIERWRRQESLRKTFLQRPDLLEKVSLSEEDKAFLGELKAQEGRAGEESLRERDVGRVS